MDTIEELKRLLELEKDARRQAEERLARKTNELQLLNSSQLAGQFYEDVLNNIPADIAVFSPEHTYLYLNPVAIKDPELRTWMIGKNDEDYCIRCNRPLSIAYKRRELFNYVVTTKKLHSWEEKLITPNGNFEHHLRHMYPVLNGEGEISLVIGYGINITDRKKIEEQLKVNEKRYRDLFNYSQAFICTHDLKGTLLSVNPALCELLGYRSDELVGKKLTDFIPEHDIQEFMPGYMDYVLKEGRASGVFTVVHKSGSEFYLLYQNYKVEEEHTEPYIIGFSQDITERIRAERELKIAKRLTDDAGKAKEVFLANMSHEIRTPMNGILGIATLLSKTHLDKQQAHFLKLISESANNLLVIVNDVLDIEKIASGKFEFEHLHFRIADKIAITVQSFQYKAEEKHLRLSFHSTLPDDFVVIGDPYRLSQVLNNLLGNALKFTEIGEIMVSVYLQDETSTDAAIGFKVTDTGIGIGEELIKDIFNPFTQAGADVSRKYGGTGLGLSICKNLLELQHGRLNVSSIVGEGTTFECTIPYKKGDPAQLVEVRGEINIRSLRGRRILVAEDVELNQFLVKHILQSWGIIAEVVSNGVEAVTEVQSNTYDLVLMDIQMPEMDGITATRRIRELPDSTKSAMPIVALTANALKGDDLRYIDAGMNGYITKPYTEENLFKVISGLLKTDADTPDHAVETDRELVSGPVFKSDDRLYDLAMVESIGKNTPGFVQKMVHIFLDTFPNDLTQLLKSLEEGNLDLIARTAHKMKPTIEGMGIVSLKPTVKNLEIAAKANDVLLVAGLVKNLEAVILLVIGQLQADFPQD